MINSANAQYGITLFDHNSGRDFQRYSVYHRAWTQGTDIVYDMINISFVNEDAAGNTVSYGSTSENLKVYDINLNEQDITYEILECFYAGVVYYRQSAPLTENASEFTVYPNPASDRLKVKGASGEVKIFNSLGQVVWLESAALPSDLYDIDLSTFPAGLYFVVNGENRNSFSVVK